LVASLQPVGHVGAYGMTQEEFWEKWEHCHWLPAHITDEIKKLFIADLHAVIVETLRTVTPNLPPVSNRAKAKLSESGKRPEKLLVERVQEGCAALCDEIAAITNQPVARDAYINAGKTIRAMELTL